MKKAWRWLKYDNNWAYVLFLIAIVSVIAWIVISLINYTPLTEGAVTNKFYEPAHQVYDPIYITVDGKNQTIPRYRYVGDRWKIVITNGDDTDVWYVSESYYDSVHVGDWVNK